MKCSINLSNISWADLNLTKFVGILILVFLTGPLKLVAQNEKPNIIFILTDDHRWDALGFAGNKIIQTPEMDRLASNGIFFELRSDQGKYFARNVRANSRLYLWSRRY